MSIATAPLKIRKALITSFGDPSCITVVDSTLPPPLQNHVQISIIYAGFAGADINMRLGCYPMQKAAPLTPGYCFVGRVSVNGPGASKFKRGDLVACLSVYDAQATATNQPEKYLVPVPEGVDLKAATALVLDWNTAYAMVMHTAKVTKGQDVFVHGLSGAVGGAVMRLCRMQGTKVYGTASERNHAALRAEDAIPFAYTDKAWISAMQKMGGVHAVFDPLGFESWDESYSILRPDNGMLVGYGGNLLTLTGAAPRSVVWPTLKLFARNLVFWTGKRTRFYYITKDDKGFRGDLERLFALVKEGKVHVPIKRVFELEDVQAAHREWTSMGGMGSVIIKVAGEQ